jgi:hypothetical protein
MSDSILGTYQNQIPELPPLDIYRYENIFRVYQTNQNQYYYSLLQSVYLPNNIDDTKIFYITVQANLPWTTISYNAYQTIELWWLICLVNKIYNPLVGPQVGTTLKAIKPAFIPAILNEIQLQLN